MDKLDVLLSLKKMFEEETPKEEVANSIIENRQIDNHNYLALIAKGSEGFIKTNPEYEAFIYLLKYQNSRVCNQIIGILNTNMKRIFLEFNEEEMTDFIETVKDYTYKLKGSNSRNRALVEDTILQWVNSLF